MVHLKKPRKMKAPCSKKSHPCLKYGLAITDFVLGEEMDMPLAKLLKHLQTCADCRADLEDWREIYAVMRTEAYHKTAEAKKRWQELLDKIHNLPCGPAKPENPKSSKPPENQRTNNQDEAPGE